MPDRVALPLAHLLEALSAWQGGRTAAAERRLAAALGEVVSQLGFRGAVLAIDAPPLPGVEVSWGSLRGESAAQGRAVGPGAHGLGRLRLDPPDVRDASLATHAVGLALAAVHGEARAIRAEGNLAALEVAIRGVAEVLAVDRVLQVIVDRVRDLADARYAALGIVDDHGVIEQFVTSGMTSAQRRRIGALPRGHGLLGLIIRENRAFRIPDIATDARRHGFPPHHPPMHSFLGVPITVKGRSIGRLYLTDKRGAPEFSDDDQSLVERFALHAGIAMENARLHDRVRRLGIVDERERISRDLHDRIIQRIYGVALSLDDVPELVREAPDEASRAGRTRPSTRCTPPSGEIRDFIFGLRPVLLEAGRPAAGPRDARRRGAAQLGDRGRGRAAASRRTAVDRLRRAAAHCPRDARQRRSARRAPRTRSSSVDGRRRAVRLEISDDGRGLRPDGAARRSHHGLAQHRRPRSPPRRARFRSQSQPGTGTRIIVGPPYRVEPGAETA